MRDFLAFLAVLSILGLSAAGPVVAQTPTVDPSGSGLHEYVVVLEEFSVRDKHESILHGPGVSEIADRLTLRYGGRVTSLYQTVLEGFTVLATPTQVSLLADDPLVIHVQRSASVGPQISSADWVDFDLFSSSMEDLDKGAFLTGLDSITLHVLNCHDARSLRAPGAFEAHLDCRGGNSDAAIIAAVEQLVDQPSDRQRVVHLAVAGGLSPALQQAVLRASELGHVLFVVVGESLDAATLILDGEIAEVTYPEIFFSPEISKEEDLPNVTLRLSTFAGLYLASEPYSSVDQLALALLGTIPVDVSESGSFPKTVTWVAGGGHEDHEPFTWARSWGSNLINWGSSVSLTVSQEACNADYWARVVQDTPGGGTLPHTSSEVHHSVTVIDSSSFDLQGCPSQDLPVGGSVQLDVPEPHASRHCDSAGTFTWQVLSGGQWQTVPGFTNDPSVTAQSSTAGTETYRVRCTYPGEPTHFSGACEVTWDDAASSPLTVGMGCGGLFNGVSYVCSALVSGGSGGNTFTWTITGATHKWWGPQSRRIFCYEAGLISIQVTVTDSLGNSASAFETSNGCNLLD